MTFANVRMALLSPTGDTKLRTPMERTDYLSIRRRFEPESIRLVIVAESPPASGKYFYNPTGALSEPLFAALMKQLAFAPTTKEGACLSFNEEA